MIIENKGKNSKITLQKLIFLNITNHEQHIFVFQNANFTVRKLKTLECVGQLFRLI